MSELGVLTPPVGLNIFVLAAVAKDIPMRVIFKGVVPFILTVLLFLVIMTVFPQITLFLPYLMK